MTITAKYTLKIKESEYDLTPKELDELREQIEKLRPKQAPPITPNFPNTATNPNPGISDKPLFMPYINPISPYPGTDAIPNYKYPNVWA